MRKIIAVLIAAVLCIGMQTIGMAGDKGKGAAGGAADVLVSKLPEGAKGKEIVTAALDRLGDPYSVEKRGQAQYLDCSGLTQWAYAQAGIEIPYTAAEQARLAVENEKVVAMEDAQPGDLVFWSYPDKERVEDRFMQIGHTAIYAGDGMMIECAPSAGGVVYREVSVQGEPAFYARLYVE